MRTCAFCGADCDSQIGIARELQTQYWGGKKGTTIEYSPKVVSFFCSDDHRSHFLATGATGGEIQTTKWLNTGEEYET